MEQIKEPPSQANILHVAGPFLSLSLCLKKIAMSLSNTLSFILFLSAFLVYE